MLLIYLIIVVIVCGSLAIAWSTKSLANVLVKIVLTFIAVVGIILILQELGYIVKKPVETKTEQTQKPL